jgi:hypothetical protein
MFAAESARHMQLLTELMPLRDEAIRTGYREESGFPQTPEHDSRMGFLLSKIETSFWNNFGHEMRTGAICSSNAIDNA